MTREEFEQLAGAGVILLDGATGSNLTKAGMPKGVSTELWVLEHPDILANLQKAYVEAGSQIVYAPTFGANRLKLADYGRENEVEELNARLVDISKKALAGTGALIAGDFSTPGKMLQPKGDLSYEELLESYTEQVTAVANAGVDLLVAETMLSVDETCVFMDAALSVCDLPIMCSLTLEADGSALFGGNAVEAVETLQEMGASAVGLNCSVGPDQLEAVVNSMKKVARVPVIVKPNAGLPKITPTGEAIYSMDAPTFAKYMNILVDAGAGIVGGCCGTTPEHIKKLVEECKELPLREIEKKHDTIVSSYGQAVILDDMPRIIGERINPTGKKKFKEALKNEDMDYILKEAITQQDKGAHILDVNVGLPDIDEVAMMEKVVKELQSVTSLPLQIDTVDGKAMERAMRIYNGKPMINSVNGKQVSMDEVFPLVRKYGGVVVGLTIDEEGIPKDAEGRVRVAGKIINEAAKYGIDKKDIVIDVLTMTISSEKDGAKVTLEALKRVREEFGVRTVLGVSNISFGLPRRPIVNSYFYAMAMQNGLTAGIINPSSEDMMKAYRSYNALMGFDENCTNYISTYAGTTETVTVQASQAAAAAGNAPKAAGVEMTLKYAIERGLKEEAHHITRDLIGTREPLDIIQEELIPALNVVGEGFEKGTVFLPQLLMSADAAKIAFAVIKDVLASSGQEEEKKEKIILATVKGDIHDIGKNIVKVLLENYGFDVIDLGKDVPPEAIVEKAVEENVTLVGLSALMTTTVVSMEETIKLLREKKPDCKVMVGGAVLNQDYADMIGADFYGKQRPEVDRLTDYYATMRRNFLAWWSRNCKADTKGRNCM